MMAMALFLVVRIGVMITRVRTRVRRKGKVRTLVRGDQVQGLNHLGCLFLVGE